MNTTAPADNAREPSASELLDRLGRVDAAEAPAVADDLARLLASSLEDSTPEAHRQLAAEFDEAGR